MPGLHHLELLLWVAPALTIGLAALLWFRFVCATSQSPRIDTSGFSAARQILDAACLAEVSIQPTPGHLNDHYESNTKTVRLSNEVYHGRSTCAVGVAAGVAGCALQHAANPWTTWLHNAAAIGAGFGCGPPLALAIIGVVSDMHPMAIIGVVLFNVAFALQVVCLPLHCDACLRARRTLADLGHLDPHTTTEVVRVMNASTLLGLTVVLQPFATVVCWIRG